MNEPEHDLGWIVEHLRRQAGYVATLPHDTTRLLGEAADRLVELMATEEERLTLKSEVQGHEHHAKAMRAWCVKHGCPLPDDLDEILDPTTDQAPEAPDPIAMEHARCEAHALRMVMTMEAAGPSLYPEVSRMLATRCLDAIRDGEPAPEPLIGELVWTGPKRPRVVCLCGSMEHWAAALTAYSRETAAGRIVLATSVDRGNVEPTQDEIDRIVKLHLAKVALADEILVLNVRGHVGKGTEHEITYARMLGRRVRWLEPKPRSGEPEVVPTCCFCDREAKRTDGSGLRVCEECGVEPGFYQCDRCRNIPSVVAAMEFKCHCGGTIRWYPSSLFKPEDAK